MPRLKSDNTTPDNFGMIPDATSRAAEIIKRLKKLYPKPIVELDYSTPFELLVASRLAAQNRDTTINKLTPALFRKYQTPADYVNADQSELEIDIKDSGFFRQKAKALKDMSQMLIDKFDGRVPETMEELVSLPGVGRKTANVILSFAMGKSEGIVVDTHHIRLSERLGFTKHVLADKIEKDLVQIVPKKDWIMWSSAITLHGRRTCVARFPKCEVCTITDLCPSAFKYSKSGPPGK